MLDRLSAPEQPQHPAICFTYWLQWHLTKQLKSASEFARQHQIALKGDLPIGGLSPYSACPCFQSRHRWPLDPCRRDCQQAQASCSVESSVIWDAK